MAYIKCSIMQYFWVLTPTDILFILKLQRCYRSVDRAWTCQNRNGQAFRQQLVRSCTNSVNIREKCNQTLRIYSPYLWILAPQLRNVDPWSVYSRLDPVHEYMGEYYVKGGHKTLWACIKSVKGRHSRKMKKQEENTILISF